MYEQTFTLQSHHWNKDHNRLFGVFHQLHQTPITHSYSESRSNVCLRQEKRGRVSAGSGVCSTFSCLIRYMERQTVEEKLIRIIRGICDKRPWTAALQNNRSVKLCVDAGNRCHRDRKASVMWTWLSASTCWARKS